MSIPPPMTDLHIDTADSGFYRGFSKQVTIISKLIIGGLIIWAVAFPDNAGAVLSSFNGFLLENFAHWYIYVMALFVVTCIGLGSMACGGTSCTWPTWRPARILTFLMVFDDVRSRNRCRNADVFDRPNLSFTLHRTQTLFRGQSKGQRPKT